VGKYNVLGLALVATVTAIAVVVAFASSAAPKAVGAKWRGTILCATKVGSVVRTLGVDDRGHLTAMTIRSVVSPGQKVELALSPTSQRRPAGAADAAADARSLGRATEPLIVRTRVIEDSQAHYRFYRNDHPSGCRVAFGQSAAVSVAKLILSGRPAVLRLGVRDGGLVHLAPRDIARSDSVQAARATEDLEHFLALIGSGRSIAACAVMARDAVLSHDECIMILESAKFVYRDRYAHATVGHIGFFDLDHHSYALATINRGHSTVRAILIRERGRYRYRGDFEYSPFELW
jgi:hypothetical protein